MDLIVDPAGGAPWAGSALWNGRRLRCALGKAGVSRAKREGDLMTPVGAFAMRWLYYRPDRETPPPRSGLRPHLIHPNDGWCDAPADPAYNRPVALPYPASAEQLWRADRLYDLIVPLGYNDAPVVPGAGSAIFLHVASPEYGPTAGCVALAPADLLSILVEADENSRVVVEG